MKHEKPPSLPIPPLEQTINRYIERIRPLLDDTDFYYSEKIARCFLTGMGKKLHQKLEQWSHAIPPPGSWLKPMWDDGYLFYRSELNGNMNYSITLNIKEIPRRESFAQYCAGLVSALTAIYLQIVDSTLPQDKGRNGLLCMEQYQNVFGACRIPRLKRDELFVGEKSKKNAHIVILFKENIYTMQVTDKTGMPCNIYQLTLGLEELLQCTDNPAPNIGAMTTAQREEAAILRQHLCDFDNGNINNFKMIETALFALCIDQPEKERNMDDVVLDNLYGYGKNRWFDKCSQVIVGTDYHIGFNNEHTGFDGATWMGVLKQVYPAICGDYINMSKAPPPAIHKLDWRLDEKAIATVLQMQEKNNQRRHDFYLRMYLFDDFGSSSIKSLKISPDAFFHLSLQLAWYRLYGRVDSTYEAVEMRNFYQGRTECTRPSTAEALKFAAAFEDSRTSREELSALARSAAKRHVELIGQCQQAQGPERHLTGLQVMLKGECLAEKEDIFSSKGYKKLKHDILSTSGLSADYVASFGFGAVVPNGFGIGYGICAENINFTITCFEQYKDEIDILVKGIKKALLDIRDIIQ